MKDEKRCAATRERFALPLRKMPRSCCDRLSCITSPATKGGSRPAETLGRAIQRMAGFISSSVCARAEFLDLQRTFSYFTQCLHVSCASDDVHHGFFETPVEHDRLPINMPTMGAARRQTLFTRPRGYPRRRNNVAKLPRIIRNVPSREIFPECKTRQ